nr:tetratricopeptide repeat protein [bacterium]
GEIPLILLATERPGEKEISLESTIRESGIPHEKIILQPFSQDECKNFLSILLDSSVMIDGATLRILFQKSEGNPLFLSEIVYTLIENEFVEKHEDYFYFSPKLAGFDIPENIHGLLLKKIDKFPQDVKHAIQFASIIGFQFPQSIWENMYESTPHISFFGDVLAQLKSERFLVVDDATRQIKFTNAAVRGATESTVLRRNKKKIHRIAAELGAGIFEKDSRKWVSFLSFHYYGAEMFDEAIPVMIQALEFRAKEYNFEIGHSLYLHCMEALEKTESQDWDSYMKLYELAFQLFDLTGMYDDMNNLLGRMETIAGRSGNIEHKLKSDYHHCFYFSRKGDFEKSNEFGYRAIENLKKLNNPEMEANILNLIGANHMLSHEYSKAIKYFKMSAGVKVKRIVVKSLGNIAIVKRLQGKYYDAIDNLQKGLVLSQEIGDQRSIFSKIHKLGHVYFLTSKFDEAIERNLDALEIAENLGDALAISSVKGNIARLFIATKNFKDARKTLIETLQIAKRINNSTHIATCYSNLGTVDKAEGFFDKAIENLKKSIEIAEQTENKRAVAMRKYEIGKLYLIVGNLSKAKIEITESIRIYKMLRLDYRYFSEVALAELHFYIAEHEKSLKILEIATQKLFDVEGFRDEYFEAVCLKMENFNAMSKYKKSVKTLEANKQLVEDANKENAGVLFIFLNYLEAKISLKSVVDEKYIDLLESAILQEENPKYPVFLLRLSKIYHHLGEELKSKTALIKSERILLDQSERIEEINLRENFLRSPLFRGFLNN